jgi:hypothetical protein
VRTRKKRNTCVIVGSGTVWHKETAMNSKAILVTAILLFVACASGRAQPQRDAKTPDLTKIDRKIGKEPAYKKSPEYCLVVFGSEAKLRVWVVVDGDIVYVDRNGNGDLTEKGKSLKLESTDRGKYSPPCEVGDILDPHTKLTHKEMKVGLWGEDSYRISVDAAFESKKIPRLYGFANVTFARKPADAPVVHFGGPLRMGLSIATIDDRPAFLCALIGTPGAGKGSFVDYSHSVFSEIDPKLKPDVELEYPGEKDAVVREKAKFYRDSIEGVYLYPVKSGAKEDKREVKITLSFPDWGDGKVAPQSFTKPILTLEK